MPAAHPPESRDADPEAVHRTALRAIALRGDSPGDGPPHGRSKAAGAFFSDRRPFAVTG
jgi:hypothetical protein